jgi:hypothetical protein
VAPWAVAGGGGGMLGGVDRGCVFTSAGESGIAAAFFLSAGEKRQTVRQLGAQQAGLHLLLGQGLTTTHSWAGPGRL